MKIDGEDLTATLPPLDDDDHQDEHDEDGADDIDAVPDQDGDPLDDTTPGEIVGEDGLDDLDGAIADGEDDGALTDVGDMDVDFREPDIGDPVEADVAGPADVDPDLEDDPVSEDDAGAEGTTEPIEQMIDGDLPALDDDDEGDFEETLLRDTGLVESEPDEDPARRTEQHWQQRADLFRPTPLGGRPFGAMDAMAFDPRTPAIVIGATLDGRLLVSGDGGRTAAVSDGWRELEQSARASEGSTLVIAVSGPRSAILVADGHVLAQSLDLGATWHKVAGPRGRIVAMTALEDGALAVLAVDASGSWLGTSADGSSWSVRVLGLAVARGAANGRMWLACAGEAVAVGDAVGVSVSRDGGLSFDRIAGCGVATAGVFMGNDTAAPLVVAVSEAPGQESLLQRIDHRGGCGVVARLGAWIDPAHDEEDEGPSGTGAPIALAWDGARVWGAGPFGIAAWDVQPAAPGGRGGEGR